MNYISKKVIAIVTVVSLLIIPSFASEQSVNLEYITSKALEHNTDWMLIQRQLEREYEDYRTAINLSKSISPSKSENEGYTYDEKEMMELAPLEADKSLSDKKYEELQQKNSLRLSVIDKYFAVVNDKDQLKMVEDDYENMKQQLESKKLEYELGQITELELQEFQKTYDETYLRYLEADKSLENARAAYNVFVGDDATKEFTLAGISIPNAELNSGEFAILVEEITTKSYKLRQIEKNIAIAQKEKDLKSRFKGFGDVKTELNQLEDNIFNYENQLENMERSLTYEFLTKYNDVLIAKSTFEVAELQFEIENKNYEVAQLKYDNGLVSYFDFMNARIAYERAYYTNNNAKLAYYIAAETYNNYIVENTTEFANE